MAWKASKTKLVKSKYLISAIIFGAMVPYMTIFGNIFGHIIKSSRNQYNGNLQLDAIFMLKWLVEIMMPVLLFCE